MYSGMTKDSLEWQKKIRKFVDTELIPWEIYAEKNEGNIPSEIEKKHQQLAIKFGLPGMGISKKEGGLGLSMFEQMIIWEQLGRVTNAFKANSDFDAIMEADYIYDPMPAMTI